VGEKLSLLEESSFRKVPWENLKKVVEKKITRRFIIFSALQIALKVLQLGEGLLVRMGERRKTNCKDSCPS
jgi:hypothetical protein